MAPCMEEETRIGSQEYEHRAMSEERALVARCSHLRAHCSRRQIHCGNDLSERNIRAYVCFANVFGVRRFEEAHALVLAGNERRTNVAYLPALGGKLPARLNRRFLCSRELLHFDSRQVAFHHVHGHVRPPETRAYVRPIENAISVSNACR